MIRRFPVLVLRLSRTPRHLASSAGLVHGRQLSSGIRAQSAVYTETGEPSKVLRVVSHDLASADTLTGTQAIIRMLAAPVNPSDLNQIEGVYPVKGRFIDGLVDDGAGAAIGGNEGVAEVVAAGPLSKLQPGDWVVPHRAGAFGTWATHAVVPDTELIVIPAEWRGGRVRALDVASVKVNPSTAYRMLRDFGRLDPGDYVVQNGANSGVGRAVIQLARQMGVRTVNVVRDRDDFDRLEDELLRLGADVVVKDKELGDPAVKDRLKALDGPVRLGFNCVGGRSTLAMTKFLSPGATLVSYGGMSRQPVTMPTSLLLFKDISACGFWMNRWYSAHMDSPERAHMWHDILRLVADGCFVSQPMTEIEWPASLSTALVEERVRQAVAWAAGNKHAFVFKS
ncbi:mitochondrial 2-enoyl thioester reductase [Coemansia sp. RSA 1933]|nr:mitochondrial 2-enoyl thioester reductase [Coemansia sp. RSA 1933]